MRRYTGEQLANCVYSNLNINNVLNANIKRNRNQMYRNMMYVALEEKSFETFIIGNMFLYV